MSGGFLIGILFFIGMGAVLFSAIALPSIIHTRKSKQNTLPEGRLDVAEWKFSRPDQQGIDPYIVRAMSTAAYANPPKHKPQDKTK